MGGGTHFWELPKKFSFCEHFADQSFGCNGIVKGDVVRDLAKIFQGRLGPNQSSHLDIRVFASSWETTLPSEIAFSPLAIPSRSLSLDSIDS